jgi:hypothetical protein
MSSNINYSEIIANLPSEQLRQVYTASTIFTAENTPKMMEARKIIMDFHFNHLPPDGKSVEKSMEEIYIALLAGMPSQLLYYIGNTDEIFFRIPATPGCITPVSIVKTIFPELTYIPFSKQTALLIAAYQIAASNFTVENICEYNMQVSSVAHNSARFMYCILRGTHDEAREIVEKFGELPIMEKMNNYALRQLRIAEAELN